MATQLPDLEKGTRRVDRKPRYRLQPEDELRVRFYLHHDPDSVCTGYTQNISLSGMKIVTDFPVDARVGDLVTIDFSVPRTFKRMRLKCRLVRFEKGRHFGLEFLDLKDQNRSWLEIGITRGFSYLEWRPLFVKMKTWREWLWTYRWSLLLASTALLITAWFFIYFSGPVGHYGPNRWTMWGQRFGDSEIERKPGSSSPKKIPRQRPPEY